MSNAMSNDQILATLQTLFAQVFEGDVDPSKLTADARLIEDLGMNSIGFLYMAMSVEEEFGIRFENTDFASLRTVDDVIHLIQNRK